MALLDAALARDKNSREALYYKAHLLANDGIGTAALARIFPYNSDILQLDAAAHPGKQDRKTASEIMEQALATDRGQVQALDALIQLDVQDKKPDSALTCIRQMQLRFPDFSIGSDRTGAVHMSQGKPVLAIPAYRQALARGAPAEGMIMLHKALLASGNPDQANQEIRPGAHSQDQATWAYFGE